MVEDRQVKQSCGDKVVCERWCVCVKVVCEREHVTKLSVKDGVKDGVCERWCVKEGV